MEVSDDIQGRAAILVQLMEGLLLLSPEVCMPHYSHLRDTAREGMPLLGLVCRSYTHIVLYLPPLAGYKMEHGVCECCRGRLNGATGL